MKGRSFATIGAALALVGPWAAAFAQSAPTGTLHSTDVYLAGKVTLEKARPGIPIEVRVVCDGKDTVAIQTDASGAFQINLSPTDGEKGNQVGGARALTLTGLAGCMVRAVLTGFRSDTRKIPSLNGRDSPNLGTIVLHRPEGFTGTIVSATSASASKDARKAVDKAHISWEARNRSGALQNLQHAVELDPHYAEAWYEPGKMQESSDTAAARISYLKAMEADPVYILPQQRLMDMGMRERAWQEVYDTAARILKLCPHEYPEAFYDQAFAATQLQRSEDAEKLARQGIAEDADHTVPEVERLLGSILAAKGDKAAAIEHFQNYLKWSPKAPDAAYMEQQISMLSRQE